MTMLTSDIRADALATVDGIANRHADPATVLASTGTGRARPQSLAGGAAGIALLHIERAHSGRGEWATAQAWLSAAASEPLSAGPNANLYFGAPALGFVTHAAASADGHSRRYRKALDRLDASTVTLTHRHLEAAHARIARGERPVLSEFDLIRGLAGLGAYHLTRHPDHDTTRGVVDYLARLTRPLSGDDLPGWWTEVSPNGEPFTEFPGGHGNLGMSHGIAAPLALLSIALEQGITVNGHIEAIERICARLDTWQQADPTGPWWPGWLTLNHAHHGRVPSSSRQRPSWCYGTPGLARAQQLAAIALRDAERQHTAQAAMLGCLRDPDQRRLLPEPGLCHGIAGLAQVAWRMAVHSPEIEAELPQLTAELLTLTSQTCTPELLDGATGTALALHTLATDTAPLTTWDRCLLLA